MNFSEAKSIFDSLTNLVKKAAMLDLEEKIIQLREYVVALKDENISLREENQSLKQELELENDFTLRSDGLFWKEGDNVPFCPKCLEGNKKRIHLQRRADSGWRCLECTNSYLVNHGYLASPRRNIGL